MSTPPFFAYINSRKRQSGTDSKFEYKINIPQLPEGREYNRICVTDALIPKTYYAVEDKRNTFKLRELGVDYTITVPPGSYPRTLWRSVVAGLMNAAGPNGWTYSITFPNPQTQAETGKATYTVTSAGGNQPSIIVGEDLFELFGFNANTTNTFVGDTLESTNVCVFNPEWSVFLHSSLVRNQEQDILAVFMDAGNVADLSNLRFNGQDRNLVSRPLADLNGSNSYSFALTNEDGNSIDLHGVNMVMTLQFWREEPPAAPPAVPQALQEIAQNWQSEAAKALDALQNGFIPL